MNQMRSNVSTRHSVIPIGVLCIIIFFGALLGILFNRHEYAKPLGGIQYVLQNNSTVYQNQIAPTKFSALSFHASSVFIGTDDNYTYSFNDTTGALQWRQEAQYYSVYPASFGNNHRVFLTNFDGRVYAIDERSGAEVWRFETPQLYMANTQPTVTDNLVLFGSRNGKLYALNEQTGALVWTFQVTTLDLSHASAVQKTLNFGTILTDDQRVYFNSMASDVLYALDKKSGKELWSFTQNGSLLQAPTLLPDSITVWTNNGAYYMLDKSTGRTMYSMRVPPEEHYYQREYPGYSHDYVIDATNTINCLDYSTGVTLWSYRDTNVIPSFMQEIDNTHVVIIGDTPNATLVMLMDTETGKQIWTKSFIKDTIHAVLPNGNTFVVVGDSHQYSVGLDGSIQWYTDKNTNIDSAMLTKTGVYLVSSKLNPVSISLLNIQDGSLRWRYQSDIINAARISVYKENIYFISKDARSIFKLNGNYSGNAFLEKDIKTVSVTLPTKFDNVKLTATHMIQNIENITTGRLNKIVLETPNTTTGLNDVYELTFHQNESLYVNKYDDSQITGTFTSENGEKFQIRAFIFGKDTWKIRFVPTSVGKWTWKIMAQGHVLNQGLFNVIPSNKPSFLTISKIYTRLFTTSDGAIFIPIGIQNCVEDVFENGDPSNQWPLDTDVMPAISQENSYPTTSMNTYLSMYAQSGFNIFRWGAGNCSFNLWDSLSVSENRYNLDHGTQIDSLFSALRDHGFHIWMSLFSFRFPFDTLPTPDQKPTLLQHYLNAIATRLTTAQQHVVIKRYLDYVVARYAGLVDVWELTNEIKLDDNTINFMSSYIRSIDPYHHPITTNWERPELSSVDIISSHWYSKECNECHETELNKQIEHYQAAIKPVVFSEQGNMNTSWDYLSATRLRIRLWIGYFNKLFYIFWNVPNRVFMNVQKDTSQNILQGPSNIYIGPTERQYVSVFSTFIANTGKTLNTQPITSEDNVYAFTSGSEILGYVYRQIDYDKQKPTTLYLVIPSDGIIRWINPMTGAVLLEQPVQHGPQILTSPDFSTDIAFKILLTDPIIPQ